MEPELVSAFSVLRQPDGGMVPAQRAWVAAYAQGPDDGLVACGYGDGSLALWDFRTEREQRLLYAPDSEITVHDPVLSVVFSPDGRLLGSTNHGRTPDRFACVWDVATGALIHRLGGFHARIHAAAFSPDGHVLALAGDDHVVTCFDVITGHECSPAFARLPYAVSALAFSPDGRSLVAGCDGTLLVIYDLTTGSERRVEGHVEWTYALAFAPHGHLFASGGEDQEIYLWEVASGQRVRELHGHGLPGKQWGGVVLGLAFNPDGALVASASHDMTARLWDVETGRCIGILPHPARDRSDDLNWVTFQLYGDEVLTGSTSGQVSRWRMALHRRGESQPAAHEHWA